MRITVVALVVALLAGVVGAREARTEDLFVAGLGGKDSGNDCRAAAAPCKTIAWALSQAGSGDAIKVAEGTYRDYLRIEESTTLTLSGGWTSGFATRDPALNRTTVVPGVNPSGGRVSTQVIIRGSGHEPAHDIIDITVDGFTFKRGKTGAVEISGQEQSSVVVRFVGTEVIRNRAGSGWPAATVSIGASGESSVSATFSRCRFIKNTGDFGGGISVRGSGDSTVAVALTNSVIADNRTRTRTLNVGAAGMDISVTDEAAQVTVDLTNTTITRNRSLGKHAGLWFGIGNSGGEMITLNLKNAILWGNLPRFEGQGGDLAEGDEPTGKLTVNADHSDLGDVLVEPSTFNDLGGTVNVDPLFREPKDIHLAASSPLIDTGTNDGAPVVDFEGDPRPADGDGDSQAITDIGADELVP